MIFYWILCLILTYCASYGSNQNLSTNVTRSDSICDPKSCRIIQMCASEFQILYCNGNQEVVNIESATFRDRGGKFCQESKKIKNRSNICLKNVTEFFKNLCKNKMSCEIRMNRNIEQEHCANKKVILLEIVYKCKPLDRFEAQQISADLISYFDIFTGEHFDQLVSSDFDLIPIDDANVDDDDLDMNKMHDPSCQCVDRSKCLDDGLSDRFNAMCDFNQVCCQRINVSHVNSDALWMVALFEKSSEMERKFLCGASLIHERVVLTAAHCTTDGSSQISNLQVIFSRNEHNLLEFEAQIDAIYTHPDFNIKSFKNNVALVFLKTVITQNRFIQPLRFNFNKKRNVTEYTNKRCMLTGYGHGKNNVNSQDLNTKKRRMQIVEQAHCVKASLSISRKSSIDMFCAQCTDCKVCTGDGGSPLVCYDDHRWQQIGILVSGLAPKSNHSEHCATLIFYVDLSFHSDWIRDAFHSFRVFIDDDRI